LDGVTEGFMDRWMMVGWSDRRMHGQVDDGWME